MTSIRLNRLTLHLKVKSFLRPSNIRDIGFVPRGDNSRFVSFGILLKISKHLGNWKGVYFFLGSQVTLIQACLFSTPLYFQSLFRILVVVANIIEKSMRDFLCLGGLDMNRDHLMS